MPRRLLAFATAFVLIFLFLASPGFAEEKFRVSSYIPDKFHDFQWLISGGTGMAGRCDTRVDRYLPSVSSLYSDNRTEVNQYQLDFSTTVLHRVQTLSRDIELSSSLTGSASDDNSDGLANRRVPALLDRSDQVQNDVSSYRGLLISSAKASQYLVSDLALMARGFVSLDFEERRSYVDQKYNTVRIDTTADITTWTREQGRQIYETTLKDHYLEGEFTVAWGRVYEGRYGATALFIVDRIRRSGLLVRHPSYREMHGLARLVYTCREAYTADERYHRIYSLDSIITYLSGIGAIDDPGPYGHLLIEDVWDYYPAYSREFGWRVMAGVGGNQNHDSRGDRIETSESLLVTQQHADSVAIIDTVRVDANESDSTHYYRKVDHADYAVIKLEYYRPLGLHWQWESQAAVRKTINRPRNEGTPDTWEQTYDRKLYELSIQSSVRYIFDARTDLLSVLELDHHYRKDEQHWRYYEGSLAGTARSRIDKEWRWTVDFTNYMTYRISVPTTLAVGLGVHWERNNFERDAERKSTSDKFRYDLNLSLAHYLF